MQSEEEPLARMPVDRFARRIPWFPWVLLISVVAACQAQEINPRDLEQGTQSAAQVKVPGARGDVLTLAPAGTPPRILGLSEEGRPIEAFVLGDGPETVLFLATIHGDEAAGTPLLERLVLVLEEEPQLLLGKRAVIVPVVNPDGFDGERRRNARGVDLNRNFPARNQADARHGGEGALSEPESAAIAALIDELEPSRAVSIHQPLCCVDFDGPGAALAQAMARACGLAVRKLGGRPGSLGTWLGQERGIPIVTLELPKRVEGDADSLWEHYGPALLAALAFED